MSYKRQAFYSLPLFMRNLLHDLKLTVECFEVDMKACVCPEKRLERKTEPTVVTEQDILSNAKHSSVAVSQQKDTSVVCCRTLPKSGHPLEQTPGMQGPSKVYHASEAGTIMNVGLLSLHMNRRHGCYSLSCHVGRLPVEIF